MHENSTRENRETLLPSVAARRADRWEKAMSHKTHTHGDRESHSEIVEGRPLTKENAGKPNPNRMQSRENGPSGLDRVRQAAKGDPKMRFTALLHHVDVDLLRSSYNNLKRGAAAGVYEAT
jgi:hypothetical protein